MVLYEGAIFTVERRAGRDVVVHPPVAAVVALDADDHLTLVRQERVAAGGKLLELPAGFVEEGETPLAAAQRELAEETGLHGGEWTELTAFYTSAGFTDEKLHLFLATGLEHSDASPEETEEIELVRLPLGEVTSLLERCDDAKTLVGLMFLARKRGL